MSEKHEQIEMFVAGLVLDPQTSAPIVVLKDTKSDICLPIWIGLAEATAIASALKKVEIQRPMTHDLLQDVIAQLGAKVLKVTITSLRESTFLASIELVSQDSLHIIDSRPSDAIALAVRTGCPILVAAEVLQKAQVTLVAVQGGESEDQVFYRPVNEAMDGSETNFANIEKDRWAEILEKMAPEEFKYKM